MFKTIIKNLFIKILWKLCYEIQKNKKKFKNKPPKNAKVPFKKFKISKVI
jgi:hypothetical protein